MANKLYIKLLVAFLICITAVSCTKRSTTGNYIIPSKVYSIGLDSDDVINYDTKAQCRIIDNGKKLSGRTHFRGGYSSRFGKHSYAVKIDKKHSIAGLPEDKDFILNASFIDKTFIRHKLSFDLFRMMNPDNKAPLCTYAGLYTNGQYNGFYVVMQKMDASTLGIDKTDNSSVIFKDPPIFYENKIVSQDSSNYYQQTYPKKKKEDRTYQAEELHNFIFLADDSTFNSKVADIFDLSNIADWHILLLMTNNCDGIRKNFFLYKCNDSIPYRIALWDYDHSFGRDGDGEYNMLSRNVDMNRNQLVCRLMRTSEYRQMISRRWEELRNKKIIDIDNIVDIINANATVIRDAAIRDTTIWPISSESDFFDDTDFDKEIRIIKDFVALNVQRLDSYFVSIGTIK